MSEANDVEFLSYKYKGMRGAIGVILVLMVVYVFDNYRHNRYPPGVLVSSDPDQGLIAGGVPWKENGNQFTPLADFHITARVLHTEGYWLDHGSAISPLDLAVGWGPMSDQTVLDEISITQGGRWYNWRPAHQRLPLASDEIVSHSANIHTIPATPDIKKQLRDLREGDIAELDGYLVEVQLADGGKWKSSLSRTDVGGGACELMWVRAVTVRPNPQPRQPASRGRTKREYVRLMRMAILQFPKERDASEKASLADRMKIDLDGDDIRRLIDAVDHYEAYLHSQQRDEAKFRELLIRLRQALGNRSARDSE